MTRGLFDPPIINGGPVRPDVVEQIEREKAESRAKTETSRPRFGPDVARAIETKHGPFRRVRGAGVVDEFYLLELRNGAVIEETIGGLRRKADAARGGDEAARRLIVASIESGLWREVKR